MRGLAQVIDPAAIGVEIARNCPNIPRGRRNFLCQPSTMFWIVLEQNG